MTAPVRVVVENGDYFIVGLGDHPHEVVFPPFEVAVKHLAEISGRGFVAELDSLSACGGIALNSELVGIGATPLAAAEALCAQLTARLADPAALLDSLAAAALRLITEDEDGRLSDERCETISAAAQTYRTAAGLVRGAQALAMTIRAPQARGFAF